MSVGICERFVSFDFLPMNEEKEKIVGRERGEVWERHTARKKSLISCVM